MRPKDRILAADILAKLAQYESAFRALPGIVQPAARDCLVEQILESIHRIEFLFKIDQSNRPIDLGRKDPADEIFDPYRAAILFKRMGNINEACWLIFLAVHFGKHVSTKWALPRAVYGRLGQGGAWDWGAASANPSGMVQWIVQNQNALKDAGKFSNHRAYMSLKATHTGRAIEDYIAWVGAGHDHSQLFYSAVSAVGNDSGDLFNHLYATMNVTQFGRLAKFDFLTLLGKLRLAPIEPNSTYIASATGPLRGARLLFGGSTSANIRAKLLEEWLAELGDVFHFDFGMQVLEDSLCNWQKSPTVFVPFRG